MAKKTTRKFKAEVSQVLSLVINSLYSNKEIFLRELISNASDALDKLQFQALTEPDLLSEDPTLRIRIEADEEAGTLTVWDNGVGMSRDELIEQLGTVAHSGSKAFMEALKESADGDGVNIIGQFGVGFYSAYLVADRVEVVSRKAGSDEAYRWFSDAQEKFTVEPAERAERGTSVTLHLRDEHEEFLQPMRLRHLVKQYSDFVGHPIEMQAMDEEADEDDFERVNQASALWRRPSSEITDEQYEELYTHITHDWQPPAAHIHFKVEGMQFFTGLLYVPSRAPFDLFDPDARHGVRLFVKRVFVMDDAEALVPRWLRFIRGVVDSDDLPLNVSREMLQDSRPVQVIRKQVIKKSLEMLREMADDRPEDYAAFWQKFGAVLKEGLHYDPTYADDLAPLLRFRSSTQSEPTSLDDYVERMAEDQQAIYYALGASRDLLESSPHLEVLKGRGFEVLYLTDSIDQWAVGALHTYQDYELVDAIGGELDLGDDDEEESEEKSEALEPLTSRFQEVLAEDVAEVRLSKRLADSPACLVVPEGGVASHIERLLRAQGQEVPKQKRILELNPSHPLIDAVRDLNEKGDDGVSDWIELIYDQALLAEGSPIEEPGKFAQRMTTLMQEVAQSRLG